MDWFVEWVAKPFGVVLLWLVTISVSSSVVVALVGLAVSWRQLFCKHTGYIRETQACDAICCECGANLGFIGQFSNDERYRRERR